MKHFFTQDKVTVGLVAGLGSELLLCLLLAAALLLGGWGIDGHQRWFSAMFIPPLLILRAYAKGRQHPVVSKTLATVLFVTFVAFMFYLFQAHLIVLR